MESQTFVSAPAQAIRQEMAFGTPNLSTLSKIWQHLSDVAVVGPYLLAALLGLVLSLCLLHKFIIQDGKPFVAPGSDATPITQSQSFRISFYHLFRLRQPRTAPALPSSLWLQRGCLEGLPNRKGPRPEVVGIIPQQRQLTQSNPELYEGLFSVIASFARNYPASCYLGRSSFEKRNTALFAQCDSYTQPRYYGEICHAHPTDGSMHLTLHPADVKAVVEAGWGERHPLARSNWWWRLLAPVPAGYTMIYCPRNEIELQHIQQIIRAAAWWVTGMDSRKVGESYG